MTENKVIRALEDQEQELIAELEKTRKMLTIARGKEKPTQVNLSFSKNNFDVQGKTHAEMIIAVMQMAGGGLMVAEICNGLKKIGMDGSSKNFYSMIYQDLLRLKDKQKVSRKDKRWYLI